MMSMKLLLLLAFAILCVSAIGVGNDDRRTCPYNSKVTDCKKEVLLTGSVYNCTAATCNGPDCEKAHQTLCDVGLKYAHLICGATNLDSCQTDPASGNVVCECTQCGPNDGGMDLEQLCPAKGSCTTDPKYCTENYGNLSYCGVSSQPEASIGDGSGCSCSWNHYLRNGKCAPIEEAVAPALPCEGICCSSMIHNYCEKKDPEAYCGKSEQEVARFPDRSGCSCKSGMRF